MAAASREYVAMFSIGAKLLGSFKGAMSAAQSRLRKLQLTARSVMKGIGMMGAALTGLAIGTGIAAAGIALRKVLSGAEEAYNEQLLINTQLTSVLQANAHIQKLGAGAAEKQVELLGAQAGELQKIGVVSDEALLAGAKQLAIYDLSPKKISEMMPILGNVLAATKGVTATQQDSQKVAMMIGKGIGGQLMGIKKLAPALSEFTQKQWKALSAEERRVKINDALVKTYGDANAALGQTPIGIITRAQHAFGELQERVGKIKSDLKLGFAEYLIQLLPKLEPIIDRIGAAFAKLFGGVKKEGKLSVIKTWGGMMVQQEKATTDFSKSIDSVVGAIDKLATAIEWVAKNKDWLLPLAKNVAILTGVLYGLSVAIAAVSAVMAVTPIGWLIIGIGALVVALVWVITHWQKFKEMVQSAWDSLGKVPIIGPVLQASLAPLKALVAVIDWLINVDWGAMWETMKTAGTAAVDSIMSAWTDFTTWLTTPIDFSAVWASLTTAFANAIVALKAQWNAFVGSLHLPGLQFGGVPGAAAAQAAAPLPEAITGYQGAQHQFGGIVKSPMLSTLAERGPEAVIPLTGGRRAEGLLNYASNALGMGADEGVLSGVNRLVGAIPGMIGGAAGPTALSFAPVVTINGNATETEQRAMDSRLRDLASDFIKQFTAAQQQERRLSYEGGYG